MENPFLNNKIIPASKFELYISPFTDILPVLLKFTTYSSHPTFGFTFQNDDILKIFFVKTIKPKYPASEIFYNPRYTKNKLRGSFVTSIHGTRFFTSAGALKNIYILNEQGMLELSLTFALENKL